VVYWAAADLPRPAGAALATLLAARLDATLVLELIGGLCVALAAVGCLTPLRGAGGRPVVVGGS